MSFFQESPRRVLGAFLLTLSGLQVVAGFSFLETFLKRGSPIVYILYWMACFGFTGLALLVALLDMMLVRREIREEQKKLIAETLAMVKSEKEKLEQESQSGGKADRSQ